MIFNNSSSPRITEIWSQPKNSHHDNKQTISCTINETNYFTQTVTNLLHFSQMVLSLLIVSQNKNKDIEVLIRTLPPCALTQSVFVMIACFWNGSGTVPESRALPALWMIPELGTTKCEVGHPDQKGLRERAGGSACMSRRVDILALRFPVGALVLGVVRAVSRRKSDYRSSPLLKLEMPVLLIHCDLPLVLVLFQLASTAFQSVHVHPCLSVCPLSVWVPVTPWVGENMCMSGFEPESAYVYLCMGVWMV